MGPSEYVPSDESSGRDVVKLGKVRVPCPIGCAEGSSLVGEIGLLAKGVSTVARIGAYCRLSVE